MGLFDFLFGKKKKTSAEEAKERLIVLLRYERKKLPTDFRVRLKEDLVEVFKKYPQFDVDKIRVDLVEEQSNENFEQLVISIPFKEEKKSG